jgi:hypothetical protein
MNASSLGYLSHCDDPTFSKFPVGKQFFQLEAKHVVLCLSLM